MQQVSGQYLPSWHQHRGWVFFFFWLTMKNATIVVKIRSALVRYREDAGEETFTFAPQSPEDQGEICNVSTDFEEEIVIKNTFPQVVRKEVEDGAYQRKCR